LSGPLPALCEAAKPQAAQASSRSTAGLRAAPFRRPPMFGALSCRRYRCGRGPCRGARRRPR